MGQNIGPVFKVQADQEVTWTACSLKMGPIRCPQTTVTIYQTTLRNIPEERRSQLHGGGSLTSLIVLTIYLKYISSLGPRELSRHSDCLRAGRSVDRISVEAKFSAPVQTGPEAHPASCTMGTGSFPGVRCGRGVTLTPHPLLVSRSKAE